MIKDLIKDLAHDNISLSQALTRAKIVAYKVKNVLFQSWLNNELQGYSFDDKALPEYRVVPCIVKITTVDAWGRNRYTQAISFDFFDKESAALFNTQKVCNGIALIEATYDQIEGDTVFRDYTPEQNQTLEGWFKVKQQGGRIVHAGQELNKFLLKNILEQTRQKLLDTLLELDTEFPNLENEYIMSADNSKKISNIITNNIYGNQNPLQIGAGESVTQTGNSVTINDSEYQMLESLGVDKKDIIELKTIVANHSGNKDTFKDRAFKWLGTVAASIAAKGLAENIPAITDFISRHV